jgi:hypothetical protein
MTVETLPSVPADSEPLAGPPAPNQIFVLRLWRAQATEWRGRVQHVNSGETRSFRDWPKLVAHLEALLAAGPTAGDHLVDENEETTP